MMSLFQSEFILKKVVFLLIFVPLLLPMASSVHAQVTDPCTAAGTVDRTTGCGALITVYAVDANGNATSYAVTIVGQSYDSEKDDWLIGIVNDAGGALKSITLSTPSTSTNGTFAFDNDGVCDVNFRDCFAGFSSFFAPYYGYAGPDNTFTNITSGGRSGKVLFTSAIPSVSCVTPANQFCNASWFSLEGVPVTNVTEDLNAVPAGASTITANFSSPDPSALIQEIDFPSNTANPNGSNILATTNFPIPPSATANTFGWPEYVAGTPWGPSLCIPKLANLGACSLYINACWNSATQSLATASDAFCPTAVLNGQNPSQIVIKDTFDWTKQQIVPGTTVSLIAFVPPFFYTNNVPCTPVSATCDPLLQWSPSSFGANVNPVCPNILDSTKPCYISDRLVEMYGDQTTTRGSSPKTCCKSWNITATNVPMLMTTVEVLPKPGSACPANVNSPLNDSALPPDANFESPTYAANIWNNGNCLIDFKVNPAGWNGGPAPSNSGNNFFVAAFPSQLAYGLVGGPNTVLANPNTTLIPPAVAAGPWDAEPQLLGQTLWGVVGGTDGKYTLQWSGEDTAGIVEKNIQLVPAVGGTCPVPADAGGGTVAAPQGQCYETSLFQTQVNIDSVAPALTTTPCPQSPATPPFGHGWYNSEVTATCTAKDDRSGIGTAVPGILISGVSISPTHPVVPPSTVTFSQSTSVGATSPYWNATAYTSSQKLCDLANNCLITQAGPFQIDEVAPTVGAITLTPAGGAYVVGEQVSAGFGCGDIGSGVFSCLGTGSIGSGGYINTSAVGSYGFSVTATDLAGNSTTSPPVNYKVGDFSISAAPPTQTISSGHQANFTITLTALGGLTGSVALKCNDPIPSTTCTLTPSVVALGANPTSSTVTLIASKNVVHGTWNFTFTGTFVGSTVARTSSPVVLTVK